MGFAAGGSPYSGDILDLLRSELAGGERPPNSYTRQEWAERIDRENPPRRMRMQRALNALIAAGKMQKRKVGLQTYYWQAEGDT